MGLFKRSAPRRSIEEVQRLRSAARRGDEDEFLGVYRPGDATDPQLGPELLRDALAHKRPSLRPVLVHRLLDDGADAGTVFGDGSGTLHVLFGRPQHDFVPEAGLAARLLDEGADVNLRAGGFGTPLEVLIEQLKFSDDDLAPFYDVLFARPDLDLRQQSNFDRTVLDTIRAMGESRAGLLARAESSLGEHS